MCSRTAPMRRARFRCLRSFSLSSGLERRGSGGLAKRALARAQALVDASRRRRGLTPSVAQVRFGCQQQRLGGIDVVPRGRRCQSRTEVGSRDTSRGTAIPVLGDMRAPMLAVPKEQQDGRSKKADPGARISRRHVASCALNCCSNVSESTPPIKPANEVVEKPARGVTG
jgi:hypothetical protein